VAAALARDPRHHQIAALAALLGAGLAWFDFDLAPSHVAVTLTSALAGQWLATRMGWPSTRTASTSPPRFEWRSALISGLSLCLLLRARQPAWMAIAALLAVGSKFALRVPRAGGRGTKHVLNPTNGAIVMLLAVGAPVWVSPGQWGHHLPLVFALAGFGSLVVRRSARSDVTFGFLAAWAAVLSARAAWVGQPWAVPLHQLENGALALFAFHMISDPKTTPDSRAGRLAFAALVALGGAAVQFGLHRTNGLLWSLALGSLFVPLLDRVLPGRAFEWSAPGTGAIPEEVPHVETGAVVPVRALGGVRTA